MNYKRSLPFLNALLKSSSSKRLNIIKSFPPFIIDDLIKILYIISGNTKVKRTKVLQKYKKPLVDIVNANSKTGRRKIIYNQKGGFLGALIPIAVSLISGLLSRR